MTLQFRAPEEGPAAPSRPPGEIVFSGLLLALGLAALWFGMDMAAGGLGGPGALPLAAAAAMCAAGALTFLRALRRRPPARLPEPAALGAIAPPRAVALLALVAGFAALLGALGFLIGAAAFLLLGVLALGGGGRRALAVSLGATLAVHVVFRLIFEVALPPGPVPEAEILAWIEHRITGAR